MLIKAILKKKRGGGQLSSVLFKIDTLGVLHINKLIKK